MARYDQKSRIADGRGWSLARLILGIPKMRICCQQTTAVSSISLLASNNNNDQVRTSSYAISKTTRQHAPPPDTLEQSMFTVTCHELCGFLVAPRSRSRDGVESGYGSEGHPTRGCRNVFENKCRYGHHIGKLHCTVLTSHRTVTL